MCPERAISRLGARSGGPLLDENPFVIMRHEHDERARLAVQGAESSPGNHH
jgi:hypothetical protein